MSNQEEHVPVRLPSKVYDRIENEVVSLYKKLSITEVPIDPIKIAAQLRFIVKQFSILPYATQIELRNQEREGLSHYAPDFGTFIVYYDDSISYARRRFTLMHEIGHLLLGHKEESELAKKMADYYAAYALAPSPLIGKYQCEDYMDIANKFDVSQECADICFQRFINWSQYGGSIKRYEIDLLNLFS